MSEVYKFKMILHFSKFNNNYYLKLFKQKKKIEGKEINFEIPMEKFHQFQYFLPAKLYIIEQNGKKIMNFTLNLLKFQNTYHLLSEVGRMELYELIFFNEENIKLIVDGKEIKEYDVVGKFKRFALINISNYKIIINETEIYLYEFVQYNNHKGNSFQLSIYDIKNKYIVSKRIKTIENMSFPSFYAKHTQKLNKMSTDILELMENKNKFKENLYQFYLIYMNNFSEITEYLNLNLPKQKLEDTINDANYLDFIYSYIKARIFYIYYTYDEKEFNDFVKLYNYLGIIYEQLKTDNNYKIYEKISILFHLAELFNVVKKSETFLKTNFHYVKVDNVEKNSVIYLAIEFLNEYINNINENSPSFLKLIEINSGIGFYRADKIFSFDMIDLPDLKNHLKETIPSVICFYSLDDIDNKGFTYPAIEGVCINEAKLFKGYQKFSVDKNIFYEKQIEVKNISMKLSLDLKHECFGHIKFQIHSYFSKKKISQTPKKCFDDKKLKRLVSINHIIKNDTINVLPENRESDGGNYLESSYGKLPGTKYYTFVYLTLLNNIGNLLDHPELFYNQENLEKLQKFAFYKYLYENKGKELIEKEKKGIEKGEDEKSKIENDEIFNFDEELTYLTNWYENDYKNSIINKKEEKLDIIIKEKPIKTKKLLKKKRLRTITKANNENAKLYHPEEEGEKIDESKIEKKPKVKLPIVKDRRKLANILLNKSLTDLERNHYFKLYLETSYKE